MLAVLLMAGCASARVAGAEGSGGGLGRMEVEAQADARRAEVETALGHLWSVAGEEKKVGARLVFTFWAQNGALTLLRYREEPGHREGRRVAEDSFARQLRPLLTEYVRGRSGEVVLTLMRRESGWAVDSDATAQGSRPPEAKTQPVNRRGVPAETLAEASEVASKLASLLVVPSGGAASLRMEVVFEDDRITGWEHRGYQVVAGGGSPRALSEAFVEKIARVLLPFTHGVGRRTVALELRGETREGEAFAHGLVPEARTLHLIPESNVDPDFAAEYRALHEDILRRWREGVREGAELLAHYSLEEMSLWFVGGVLARGTGLLFEAVAPMVMRALTRGGMAAAGWFRTTLVRLPRAERHAFERLWMKVQMEGGEALSRAERDELLALMNRIERLIRTPLNEHERSALRDAARRYFQRSQPVLEKAMNIRGPYEIHHRCPLEYAHLFPAEDINAGANLKAVGQEVHQRISSVWTELRKYRSDVSRADVERVTSIIDEQFARWYEKPYARGDSTSELEMAMNAAKREVRSLFPSP